MTNVNHITSNTGLEIAVIGMAVRFPGAKNTSEFWEHLKNGVELISFFSDEELEIAGIKPETTDKPNYIKAKGILENKEYFDASLFGYTPVEAEILDPQVRVFQECCWHALEDAGCDTTSYRRLIGLYGGASSDTDWQVRCVLARKTQQLGSFASKLLGKDFLCSKTAYKLNLKGPAVFVQTACSTSLAAIHLACQGLLSGECDMALAGGVRVMAQGNAGYLYREGMVVSPDGHCRTFDARAAGTVISEGSGVVVLKRLRDAVEDRDHIYALVKGSAINNDGERKLGFTAPSINGQAEVIQTALHMAGVEAESIGYIEAHGTGTPLGDPVEINALKKVFHTNQPQSCAVGSVKTNIGHPDAAAGAAGFIKSVLALNHRLIPPSLHFETPNPGIDFENSPFYVNTTAIEWQNQYYPLRAGVSSFGVGGTNVHVILEEWPGTQSAERTAHSAQGQDRGGVSPPSSSREYQLIILSARTESALRQMKGNLAEYLKENAHHPGFNLADVAYTLQLGRKAFKYRQMIMCRGNDIKGAAAALSSPDIGKARTRTAGNERPVIFMFPGLGAQYMNMGKELYQMEPVFRSQMDRCFEILKPLMDCDIKEILYPDCQDYRSNRSNRSNNSHLSYINRSEIAPLVIFAVEYALAKLLMAWGIQPHAMIGYSFGEYAAACISGVFSLTDALKVIVARTRLLQKSSIPVGAMLSVPLTRQELTPLLNHELSLAIDNGLSCIAAGSTGAIDRLWHQLKEKKIVSQRLPSTHAIHSHLMAPLVEEFKEILSRISLMEPKIPYISNVTGKWAEAARVTDPVYWAQHLRETVQFSAGIKELVKEENAVFVEVGPGRDLSTLVMRRTLHHPEQKIIHLLKSPHQDVSDLYLLLKRIGTMWLYGVKLNWNSLYTEEKPRRIPLPLYPFDRERFWIELPYGQDTWENLSLPAGRINPRGCFFIPAWKPSALAGLPGGKVLKSSPPGCCWLIFTEDSGFSTQLPDQLREQGEEVREVKKGTRFEAVTDFLYTVNPQQAGDYRRLLNHIKAKQKFPGKIIFLWWITGSRTQEPGIHQWHEVQERGFYSLIHLALALGQQDFSRERSLHLYVVTHRMQHLPGEEVGNPGTALVLAPVKIIPREYPHISCTSIDIALPPPGTWQEKRLPDQLLMEFRQAPPAQMIAYRGNHRLVHGYEPVPLPPLAKTTTHERLKENGIYLITGGLEGTGFQIAKHLARTYRARLVLIEPTPLPLTNGPHPDKPGVTAGHSEEAEFLTKAAAEYKQTLGIKGMECFQGLEQALNRLCAVYILEYFKRNGIDIQAGKSHDIESLRRKLKIIPKFYKFYDFLIRFLKEDRIIRIQKGTLEFLKGDTGFKDSAALLKEAKDRYPGFKGTLNFIEYCTSHYSKALAGEIEALGVLFPGGRHAGFADNYRDSQQHSDAEVYTLLIKEFISKVLMAAPPGKTLRILEIGAGSGTLTRVLAPVLKEKNVEYYFTDIGKLFVVRAKEEAAKQAFAFMKFKTLDISTNPGPQGFAPHTFDMIVGLDVISATRSIENSIKNLKQLLTPDGRIALIEVINSQRWEYMTFGLAEGLWYFEHDELRQDSHGLSLDMWEQVLKRQGFQEVIGIPRDQAARKQTGCGLIISRLGKDVIEGNCCPCTRRHGSGKQKEKNKIHQVKELERLGAEVLVIPAEVTDLEQMRNAKTRALERWGPINGIIHQAGIHEGDSHIRDITPGKITRILAPKIKGTWVLERISRETALDFFVLCSDIDPASPPAGSMGNCAAAIFQDSFAHYKLSRDGTYIVSMSWDNHQDAAIFDRILEYPYPGVVISRRNLSNWPGQTGENDDSLTQWQEVPRSDNISPAKPQRRELTSRYQAPRNKIEHTLVEVWQAFLGIERVGIDDDFLELGADSLIFITIASKIHQALNVEIPIPEFFSRPTVKALAQYIKGIDTGEKVFLSIQPTEKREYYPLTSAQHRLFMLHQLELNSTAYNIHQLVEIEGHPDRKRLEETCGKLIRRHQGFGTSFGIIGGQPVQKVHTRVNFDIEYYDPGPGQWPIGNREIHSFIRPFDLSKAPLLRVGLLKLPHTPAALRSHPSQEGIEHKHILMVDMHHIISDGTSHHILVKDFLALYAGEYLPAMRIQYKDYSEWLYVPGVRETWQQQAEYWFQVFAGEIPLLSLPTDYPRPTLQSFSGDAIESELGSGDTAALYEIARDRGTTLFIILLTLFNVFLSKLSGQEDIVVGTPISGRNHVDLQQVIGMFVNTLALRHFPSAEKSFDFFFDEVRTRTLEIFENRDYPFEELVKRLALERDMSRNPLFDVMFVLETPAVEPHQPSSQRPRGLKAKPYEYDKKTAKFDLTLGVVEKKDKLHIAFEYCTRLFKHKTMEKFHRSFKRMISEIIKDPGQKIANIEIIPGEEKKRILYKLNDTFTDYPREKTLHRLFEDQVETTPNHIAAVAPLPVKYRTYMTDMTYISYRQLNEKSNQLSLLLIENGVKADTIVGIMMERSIEMMVGIMGILQAGGAYLPIDPDYPEERIQYMLKDSGANVLVTTGFLAEEGEPVRKWNGKTILLEPSPSTLTSSLTCQVSPANLAYIIYTSGSTGKPKGVMIRHWNVVNFITAMVVQIPFEPGKTILALTSISFDISVLEMLLPLGRSMKIVVADKEQQHNPELLETVIIKNNVNMLQITPSHLRLLMSSREHLDFLTGLEQLLVGGEVFPQSLYNSVRDKFPGNIYNLYGPTETTVWSSLKELSGQETVNIGNPIANTQIYIMDRYFSLQPLGVVGELLIGGDGTAAGYLNNPELTAEKFVSHPYISPMATLYRTGDLARWLANGNIQCLGRVDHQVKVRGYRIELNEIERLLLNKKEIEEAVVSVRQDKGGEKYLCAYVVANKKFEPFELRDLLSKKLPGYMIPSFFVYLDRFPLTPNGKIDRRALPTPQMEPMETSTAPVNEIEKKLVELWTEVLMIDGNMIGTEANFFGLGGHSLKAVVLAAKIYSVLQAKVPLVQIFKTPTVKGLSGFIKRAGKEEYVYREAVEKKEYYRMSSAQKRLFVLQRLNPGSTAYNLPLALILEGDIAVEKFEQTSGRLIQRHASFRTSFHMMDNEPVQRIHDQLEFEVQYYDMKQVEVKVEEKKQTTDDRGQKTGERRQGTDDREQTTEDRPGTYLSSPDVIRHLSSEFIHPFDLSRAPLLRVGLLKLPHTPAALRSHPSQEGIEHKHILMVDMHHMISDGISMEIFEQEFAALYSQPHKDLPQLRLRYQDYSQWQNKEKTKQAIKFQEKYWLNVFQGQLPVLHLPTDYQRPVLQDFEGRTLSFEIKPVEVELLREFALKANVTAYLVLLAAFNVFLSRLSGQEDIIVGTVTSGRGHAELEQVIGMFVNTLAFRNYPAQGKTFNQLLAEVKDTTLTAFENQDYQYEDLVDTIPVVRDTARNPLFDVVFTFRNMEKPGIKSAGLNLIPLEYERKISRFDLTLFAMESEHGLFFSFEYCTKLFKETTIKRFVNYFKTIISSILANPETKFYEIEILSADEKKRLLLDFNDTNAGYPEQETIHSLFARQEERAPDHIAAVEPPPVKNRTYMTYISYRELNEKSNQLALLLIDKGIKPGTIVGIMEERSIGMIIGILGILKAGGAYLPIDPDYPEERIRYMLKDSGAEIFLTSPGLSKEIKYKNGIVHAADAINRVPTPSTSTLTSTLTCQVSPANLAYIIYTSGSTGRPKGVLIEHKNVVRLLLNDRFQFDFSETDVWTLFHSFCFDFSVWEMYGALLYGGRLIFIPKMVKRDPARFLEIVTKEQVTVLNQTPSAFYYLMPEIFKHKTGQLALRWVIFGGEALNPIKLKEWKETYPGIQLINMYGITETTVHVTYKEIHPGDTSRERSLIGKPIPTLSVYILDKNLRPVPPGVAGEVCVKGEGVARGYLNRPELTAEKFNRDLWDYQDYHDEKNQKFLQGSVRKAQSAGRKANNTIGAVRKTPCAMRLPLGRRRQSIYRSGDLARLSDLDGEIEYLGRIDSQVKIRGYRIELGEIESLLVNHHEIEEAVVLAKTDKTGEKYLCAYLAGCSELTAPGPKDILARKLPGYMVPSFFVYLDRFPLTPNGKIDRQALRTLEVPGLSAGGHDAPPRDEIEIAIARIWQELLHLEKVGRTGNFFDLGGDSIKIIHAVARLQEAFDMEIPVTVLFTYPTIEAFAGYLSKLTGIETSGTVNAPMKKITRSRETAGSEIKNKQKQQASRRRRR